MSTQSKLLDVQGEYPASPEIRVQPTVQRAVSVANVGWTKRYRFTISNNSSEPISNQAYPIDIGLTNGLVSGGKALASGNDLRVWLNGLEVARTLVDWNSATFNTLVWVTIPYLAGNASMVYEVAFGNPQAGTPPTLTAGIDKPIFDIETAGADRSTALILRYRPQRVAANAGKGGHYLTSGISQPDVKFGLPGSWAPAKTLRSNDDSRQETYSTFSDSGTKYQARFEARRARAGSLPLNENNGADGYAIRIPSGIAAVRADIRWQNLAIGDTDPTPVGQVVILTRNNEGETWKPLYSNAALQETEATIAVATYTPAAPVKELAFAVWPNDDVAVDPATRVDRYINAAWYTTLEVHLAPGVITQSPEVATGGVETWTPRHLSTNLKAWFKADAGIGVANGAAIPQWDDSSGNALHASNATVADRPLYQTNQLNGLPGVEFVSTDSLNTTLSASSHDETILAVVDVDDLSGARAFLGTQTNDGRLIRINTGGTVSVIKAGVGFIGTSTATIAINSPAIVGATIGATTVETHVNGVDETDAHAVTFGAGETSTIGLVNAAFDPWDGMIYEIISCSALSVADRERVEGYLAHKWGLTTNLPADHPYKSAAPTIGVNVYELATEFRSYGGGDTVGVPPYKSIFLGNAKSASGIGTPRLAAELNQQIRVFTDTRKTEVWNSGLTAKVEDVPIPAVNAVDGVTDALTGETVERVSGDWMPLLPMVDPLTNSSADTVATGWNRGDVTALVTASARTRTTATLDSTPASFTVTINPNAAGSGAVVEEIADPYLPVGERESVQVGVAIRTANIDIQPTPSVWFYDASQVLIGARHQQADWTIPAINTWYRRLFAAVVPDGAAYYRVGVTAKTKAASATGQYWWDTVAVNDTEIALLDVSKGTLVLSARWFDRYAYA